MTSAAVGSAPVNPAADVVAALDVAPLDVAPLDVVGIGNALVDVLTHGDDAFLQRHQLVKGSMTLIDTARSNELYEAMGPGIEQSGGSAGNTIAGIASFGGSCGYIGKIADDQLGDVFAHDLQAAGVAFSCPKSDLGVPTGRCLIVVTADGQRTMSTYLGVSELLGPDDVDADLVASAKVVYLEGYLWDKPGAMAAYRKAAGGRPRCGPTRLAHAVRLLLRRAAPRGVPRPRRDTGRRPVRERARDHRAVPRRLVRCGAAASARGTARSPHSPGRPRDR